MCQSAWSLFNSFFFFLEAVWVVQVNALASLSSVPEECALTGHVLYRG